MAHSILWLEEKNKAGAKPAPRSRRRAMAYDEKSGRMVPVEDDLGNPVIERLPAVGHTGPVTHASPMSVRRAIEFLKFDGSMIAAPITGAAAAVPDTDRSHELYIAAKARYHGWVEKGVCPCDAVMSGQIKKQRIVDKSVREAIDKGERCPRTAPSQPPCKHFRAEEAARKARNLEEDAKRCEAAKSDAAKSADRHTEALLTLTERLAGESVKKAGAAK
jgi:hypothetical protein